MDEKVDVVQELRKKLLHASSEEEVDLIEQKLSVLRRQRVE